MSTSTDQYDSASASDTAVAKTAAGPGSEPERGAAAGFPRKPSVVADTGIASTGVADTGVANTGIADTGIASTGVAGRVVVITGGGTGIGAAIAERYASEGARVAIIGRRRGPLDEVAARIGAFAVVADASIAAEAEAAIRSIVGEFGAIDVLVANAGGHGLSAVGETSDDEWELSLRVNLTSAFVMVRSAIAQLVETRGQIVIVSSLAGLVAGANVAGYTVSKHALIGLTRSLARDYGKSGVRVNAVCPGWVRTPMADAEMDEFARIAGVTDREAAYARVTVDVPLGRPAAASEIASVVRFLGSGESSYITGAVIVVDGGAHIVDVPTLAFDHAGI